jgi:hypothetical protein
MRQSRLQEVFFGFEQKAAMIAKKREDCCQRRLFASLRPLRSSVPGLPAVDWVLFTRIVFATLINDSQLSTGHHPAH